MTQNISICKDFTRELSVWQQEIEVEANHTLVPAVLGAPCSVFFFHASNGVSTAYRRVDEREALTPAYLMIARTAGAVATLAQSAESMLTTIHSIVADQPVAGPLRRETLERLRAAIIAVWPAYLVGYNIPRAIEKDWFHPSSLIEEQNVGAARALRSATEGIYDAVESVIERALATIASAWRAATTAELLSAIGGSIPDINQSRELIIDEQAVHQEPLTAYLQRHQYLLTSGRLPDSDTLRGVVANAGTVRGQVRIVRKADAEAFVGFQAGEILVALQTSPVFVPLMRRAAGIITEHGGLSSHAAIVSRELHIPCIVGVQRITAILKNGDWIELNGATGQVHRL